MSSIPTARSSACFCRFRVRCSRLTARAWHDALKVNAGSRFALTKYASLFASLDGEFANSEHSYAGLRGQNSAGEAPASATSCVIVTTAGQGVTVFEWRQHDRAPVARSQNAAPLPSETGLEKEVLLAPSVETDGLNLRPVLGAVRK